MNGEFFQGKTKVYGKLTKIGFERDSTSVRKGKGHTHGMILTMLMDGERHFAHTVHQSEGNTMTWRADPFATKSEA